MKWAIALLFALVPMVAYAQEEIIITAEPPQEEYNYILSVPVDVLIIDPTARFMDAELDTIENMGERNRSFRNEEINSTLRRDLLKRLPNMCIIAPTSFDGDWAVGCIFHFEPTPVRAHFR